MRSSFNALFMLAAAAIGSAFGCASPALAGRLVDVTVVNRNTGERLTPYRHGGKLYVAGTPGDRYAVELRNRGGERLLTVISVDGINVLTGQTAASSQSGYVLDGWRQYAINGWRKSLDDVAAFVFTALPDSYAARTGRPDDVGVIGVAVFREQRPAAEIAPPLEPWRGSGEARERNALGSADAAAGQPSAPAPAAKAESSRGALADRRADQAQAPQKLGTGHGQREHSPTRTTEFVRAGDAPDELLTIHYDSRANLIARGIIRAPRGAEPRPFPGGIGFVPDPRG